MGKHKHAHDDEGREDLERRLSESRDEASALWDAAVRALSMTTLATVALEELSEGVTLGHVEGTDYDGDALIDGALEQTRAAMVLLDEVTSR